MAFQASDGSIHLSATDLVGHINCRYLTNLDLKVVKGTLAKPMIQDPGLDVLIERGRRHEQGYLEHLQRNGLTVTSIDGVGVDATSVALGQRSSHRRLCNGRRRGGRSRLWITPVREPAWEPAPLTL